MRVSRFWLALTFVLFCLPLFVGLGRKDLAGDEAAYSFGVDRILEIGDWLAPRSSPNEDAIFLEKPPLKFWIVAAPIRLGLLPHNEFGLRFWDALLGGIAFLYVFAIGSRLAGPWCGAVAVLLLFVHEPLVFDHGLRGNNTEAPLFLSYCGGMFHFMEWARADRSRRARHAIAAGLFFVLGFMSKDLAAIFFPMAAAGTILLFRDYRDKFVRDWRLWAGVALIVLALIAPWFIYAQWRFGAVVWRTMFTAHVYQRFTGYLDVAHLKPWNFYFATMWERFGDSESLWLVLGGLAAVIYQTVNKRWAEGGLLLLWFLPIILISFGTSKLYHYIYPFLPPLTLGAGYLTALVVMLAPVPFERAVRAMDRKLAATRPKLMAALSRPPARTILLGIAAIALTLAAASLLYGPIRLNRNGVRVFESTSVFRPSMVALLCAGLAGAGRGATRMVVPLLVAITLPLPTYRDELSRFDVGSHPMRDARDCVMSIDARPQMASVAARGLYVDGIDDVFTHEVYYYFRKLRPWEKADKSKPTAKLYEYLYDSDEWRPALVSETNYRQFIHQADGPSLPLAPGTSPPMVSFADVILLLPRPYAACSSEVAAQAARP